MIGALARLALHSQEVEDASRLVRAVWATAGIDPAPVENVGLLTFPLADSRRGSLDR